MTDHQDEHVIHARATASDDRSRVLKHGDTFAIFNRFGDIQPVETGDRGLYHDGTRFLSHLVLRIAGVRPLLLSSSITTDNSALVVDLTNPELPPSEDEPVPQDTLHLLRSKILYDGSCFERLEIANYGASAVTFAITWEFSADFRDIFEVRGEQRPRRGSLQPPLVTQDTAHLAYEGLDGQRRSTRLRFDPPPLDITETHATFELSLAPNEVQAFELTVTCGLGPSQIAASAAPPVKYEQAHRQAAAEAKAQDGRWAHIATSNDQFNDWIARSAADLRMMVTATEAGPYIYAGVPWFSSPFGRDGIITALESLTLNPSLSAGVLRYLAATQATAVEAERDAEPGKILHEARGGEMAALGEIPFQRYYGSVDATPLFVMLADAYYRRTGDAALIETIWPNLMAALAWLDGAGDIDGDGFLEYSPQARHGLANQGWKDSQDSVFHADGGMAGGPIALCEVQGYVYAARLAIAHLASSRGNHELARTQRRRAAALRRQFDERFWDNTLQTYALALDGDKKACAIRTSNAGHALFTGIAKRRRADPLARSLLGPDMFSGWGIRTLSSEAARFNPMSYHNGSIWPHDNALIASGLSRYGHQAEAVRLLGALFDAAQHMDLKRMPELFCGFERREGRGPTQYPVACLPQSWAAGAVFMILDACLGLSIDALARRIRFAQPTLPPFLDHVTMTGLAVGNSTVDIQLHRDGDSVQVALTRTTGRVDLLLEK